MGWRGALVPVPPAPVARRSTPARDDTPGRGPRSQPEPAPWRDATAPARGRFLSSDVDASSSGRTLHQAYARRTRGCLECGREFEVNPCHAQSHRFCAPSCRARHGDVDLVGVDDQGSPVLRSRGFLSL